MNHLTKYYLTMWIYLTNFAFFFSISFDKIHIFFLFLISFDEIYIYPAIFWCNSYFCQWSFWRNSYFFLQACDEVQDFPLFDEICFYCDFLMNDFFLTAICQNLSNFTSLNFQTDCFLIFLTKSLNSLKNSEHHF